MEPLARIKDCPSVTAASAAITPLEERVSASSPESVDLERRDAPPSSGDGEHQCGRYADTNDRTLDERPPAWGEQASSSPYRLKTQWRKPASLLAGKGRQHGGGQRYCPCASVLRNSPRLARVNCARPSRCRSRDRRRKR